MTKSSKKGWFAVLRFIRNSIILFFVISILWVVAARFIPVYVTPLMLIRSVEAMKEGKPVKIRKQWVPIEQISPNMVRAVIASEDNLFVRHNGFSKEAIKRAREHNRKGKGIRGGSTISQQTAKNVFLWPKRSYFRKGLEAYFTVLIEFFWDKRRIMEVYLNVIEMGDGIYGVEAASQEYFKRNAVKLNREQAALIAVCLPNPRRFNPARPSAYIKRRQGQILNLMNKIPPIDFIEPKKQKKSK